MERTRFTQEQIAYVLRQTESGVSIKEITSEEMGASEVVLYRCKFRAGHSLVLEVIPYQL